MEKSFDNNFSQENDKTPKNINEEAKNEQKTNESISKKAIESLYSRRESQIEKKLEPEELLTEEERDIKSKLEEEVNKIKSTPSREKEVREKVKEIKSLKEREKLEHLLDLASEKGISFAIKVAQRMRDPYTLDMFRDILAMNKTYEHFSK